jgi:hypothetical protein
MVPKLLLQSGPPPGSVLCLHSGDIMHRMLFLLGIYLFSHWLVWFWLYNISQLNLGAARSAAGK